MQTAVAQRRPDPFQIQPGNLGENVQILDNATVEDATLTDSVVFPDATIRHSELRRSLIDTDTHLESLSLSGAIIGAHTQLNGE